MVRFLTRQYMRCKYAHLLYLPKTPLIAFSGRKKANSKSLWWGIHTHWTIERIIWGTCLLCKKTFKKTSGKMVELGMNDKQNVYESILSYSRPRPKIANKPHWSRDNNRVDRTCRYIRIAVENLLISLVHLRCNRHSSNSWSTTQKPNFAQDEQRVSLGDLVGGPYRQINTAKSSSKRGKLYIFMHIYLCY